MMAVELINQAKAVDYFAIGLVDDIGAWHLLFFVRKCDRCRFRVTLRLKTSKRS